MTEHISTQLENDMLTGILLLLLTLLLAEIILGLCVYFAARQVVWENPSGAWIILSIGAFLVGFIIIPLVVFHPDESSFWMAKSFCAVLLLWFTQGRVQETVRDQYPKVIFQSPFSLSIQSLEEEKTQFLA